MKYIDNDPYEYNAENNTLFFDGQWLVIETDGEGWEYVITYAGNTFYLDVIINQGE